jgi:hypothetical protein
MRGSEESECYISPSLSSSTMAMISSKKKWKKRSKKGKRQIGNWKYVRRK